MGIETVIGLGLGAAGLLSQHEQQRRATNQANKANDYNDRAVSLQEDQYYNYLKPTLEKLMSLSNSYDPVAEGAAGVNQAKRTTEETIQNALKGLRADYAKGGGVPGQSTEYGVRAQGMTNRAADPLRAYLAEAMSNPTQKKIQMMMSVLGQAPAGGLTNAYFNAAGNAANMVGPGGDFTDIARLISDAFGQKSPGGGGRGDYRGQVGNILGQVGLLR